MNIINPNKYFQDFMFTKNSVKVSKNDIYLSEYKQKNFCQK